MNKPKAKSTKAPQYVRPDGVKFVKPVCLADCRCNWCMGMYDYLLAK